VVATLEHNHIEIKNEKNSSMKLLLNADKTSMSKMCCGNGNQIEVGK
jgi:hypothetical protein